MKIFIESTPIFKNRSGVGQYAKRLSETLVHDQPQHHFTFFSFRLWPKPLPAKEIKGINVSYRFIRFFPGKIYNQLFRFGIKLPIDMLLRRKADVIFFPNFTLWPTLSRKTKKVVVVHDLSFIYFPQFASPRNRRDNQKLVPRALKKANHVVTISESSKQQIIKYYGTSASKISIVPPAVDHNIFYGRPAAEVKKVAKKYKLPAKYILFTSTLEPRKNIEGLIQAYVALDAKIKQNYSLVLVGGKGWQDQDITVAIDQARAAGERIITPGYVADDDIAAIYSGASLFVFPTFYEGFGMPPLEAMACGVPVITSDNSSLPEVVGDAAIMIKAEDTAAITQAITKVLSDKKLADSLRAKGLTQSKKFNWEDSAKKLWSVFEDL